MLSILIFTFFLLVFIFIEIKLITFNDFLILLYFIFNRAHVAVFNNDAYYKAGETDILDPSNKIGIQIGRDETTRFIWKTKGKFANRILKDRLLLETCGMQFPRNHRFFTAFDRKLQQLFTAGLVDYNINSIISNFRDLKRYAHLYPDEPQVLTLEHLEAGFVIWLISVLSAAIVFFLQWLKKFVDFLILKYLMVDILGKK